MEPESLDVSADGTITIVWSDAHKSNYNPLHLRAACPCAVCKGEPGVFGKMYTGLPQYIPENVQPDRINSIGRYALKIVWSDGHDSGLYSFVYLRALCECGECKGTKA